MSMSLDRYAKKQNGGSGRSPWWNITMLKGVDFIFNHSMVKVGDGKNKILEDLDG